MATIIGGSPLRHMEHQLVKWYWFIYSEFIPCRLKQAKYPRQQQSLNLQGNLLVPKVINPKGDTSGGLITPSGDMWLHSETVELPPSLPTAT